MGLFIAITIIGLWGFHLFYILFFVEVSVTNPWMYLHMLVQSYLYTGLFITGHDAMHRTVSRTKWINNAIGYAAVFLFAGMSYRKLIKNHWDHHRYPATEKDPDFYVKSQNFFAWWFTFLKRYVTIWQLIIMAVLFNILERLAGAPVPALIVFWIIPAFLATFQLFYFGTFIPHKKPHTKAMGKHRARTQKKNHLWAMLSCYFFGYHYEH
ncbi:MAG TPA: fatty acid desaturase, partial [Bacteroides sp.]|nr:fatty acid desaturase [Bacteroides sp.]